MTVLPELVPVAIEMSKRKLTGIMNYTNPGAISHNEILELYKEYIDPDFTWENFNIEEQVCHFSSAALLSRWTVPLPPSQQEQCNKENRRSK